MFCFEDEQMHSNTSDETPEIINAMSTRSRQSQVLDLKQISTSKTDSDLLEAA